eukprot:GEMP01017479.1.p1 GENE.GEMP01017479.1~~GEMP01017479.1.p1  ORF type:complete len:587 (+),score=148.24 GEMP01017479.1:71-1831(+)
MISVSLMKPTIHPAPERLTATVRYGKQVCDVQQWPCNVSFPFPPEHNLILDFGDNWRKLLGVLKIPLQDLYKEDRLPMQICVSLEKDVLSMYGQLSTCGMDHLSTIVKRAELITSPKMQLLLTVTNIDAVVEAAREQASQAALKERKDLENTWMFEMQELQKGLEEANRKLDASIEISRIEDDSFDEQLTVLVAETARERMDFGTMEKERREFEFRVDGLQTKLRGKDAQMVDITPMHAVPDVLYSEDRRKRAQEHQEMLNHQSDLRREVAELRVRAEVSGNHEIRAKRLEELHMAAQLELAKAHRSDEGLASQLQAEREKHFDITKKWEEKHDEALHQSNEHQRESAVSLSERREAENEVLRLTNELTNTDDELRRYASLAETLEDENKKLADMLEKRNSEWKKEIQSLERKLKVADRRPVAGGRRAPPVPVPPVGGGEDASKVKVLRKELEKLRKEKEEREKVLSALREDLQDVFSRLCLEENKKDEKIKECQLWQEEVEHHERELTLLQRTSANQIANLEAKLFMATSENGLWDTHTESETTGSPTTDSAKQHTLRHSQSARSFAGKRALWPKPSELIREGTR